MGRLRLRPSRGNVGKLGMVTMAGLVCALSTAAWLSVGLSSAPAGATTLGQHSLETDSAYAIVDSTGGIMTFGGAGYSGDTLNLSLHRPIVGAAPSPNGGYWMVASDGGIFTFGNANYYGSTGNIVLNKPIVGMAPTPDGNGYWLVASDGGVFAFGDANFFGSTGNITLNKPIVGMAATPDGNGYWLVASDGGIFAFGDANFFGSAGNITLNKPIVGMATTPSGNGYWLVASDGGMFTFGGANYFGSTGNIVLNQPVVGMAATPDGGGYWLVASDGGIFAFGDAQFSGTAQSPLHPPLFPAGFSAPIAPVVAIIPDNPGSQLTHSGQLRVAFAGDSLAFYEGEYTLGTNPPYFLDNGSAPGCGFTNGALLIPWSNPGSIYTNPGACADWSNQLQWLTDHFHPDVTVLQVGYWESQYRQYNGSFQTLNDSDYANYIQSNLQEAVNIAHTYGGAVILNTAPLYNDGTPSGLVDDFNNIVQNVVNQNSSFVSLFDTYSLLDPSGQYSTVVDGVTARTPDGVHLTQAGVSQILVPPLNQLISSVGQPIYAGTS